jgi:hypothetical protein
MSSQFSSPLGHTHNDADAVPRPPAKIADAGVVSEGSGDADDHAVGAEHLRAA